MEQHIVFSGVGVVTAAGNSVDANMERMMNGESFMRPTREWDASGCNTDHYGEVPLTNSELRALIRRPIRSERLIPLERGELLLFIALEEALAAAGLNPAEMVGSRVALLAGTSLSGFTNLERAWRRRQTGGEEPRVRDFLAYPLNVLMDRVGYEFGFTGPRYLFSTACSASLHPVIWASQLLDQGEVDFAILGGADPLSMISMVGFSCLRSVAKVSSTPFSLGDPGLSIGEGAGVVIMERHAGFRERGITRSAPFFGGASGNSDAYHSTASDPMGVSIRKCMAESVQQIELDVDSSIFLVAHGTGTLHNDKVESRAIQQSGILGGIKTSSLKSMIGHTLGASGCVELALLVKSMEDQVVLPTANFSEARPGCELDLVTNRGIQKVSDVGIKSAFAFGGNNVTVCMTRSSQRNNRARVSYSESPIAITGIGILGAFGDIGEAELVARLARGESAVRTIADVSGFRRDRISRRAAVLDDETLSRLCDVHRIKDHRKMDRISKLATIAAQKCLKDSGMVVRQGNAFDVGLISGTSTGHLASVSKFYTDFMAKGPALADAGLFPNTVVNAHAGYITIQLRLKGYTTVVTQGNLSGFVALDLASRALRSGMCSMMLAGGTAEYSRDYHRALIDTGLADDEFRPYQGGSVGNILGDGSVFFALERLDDAMARGAQVLGILSQLEIGYASAIPSTFRPSSNPLEPVLGKILSRGTPTSVLGDGNGFPDAGRLEADALRSKLPGLPVRAFTEAFGYVSGVNGMNALAVACLAKKVASAPDQDFGSPESQLARRLFEEIGATPVCTCVGEGGCAAAIRLSLGAP